MRVLVHTPGDPPAATHWLQWGGDQADQLVDLFRNREIGHSTAYAAARACQIAGNWLDDPTPSVLSLGLEPAVPVQDAHRLVKGTDHGVLVYDWRTGKALIVKESSVEEVPL